MKLRNFLVLCGAMLWPLLAAAQVATTYSPSSSLDAVQNRLTTKGPARDRFGWSDVGPDSAAFKASGAGRVIYVSSLRGKDSNDGLAPDRPKFTPQLAVNMLRNGKPDWVLIECGSQYVGDAFRITWPAGLSGPSASNPMGITSYNRVTDAGTMPRPTFKELHDAGIWCLTASTDPSQQVNNVAIVDLAFQSADNPTAGNNNGNSGIGFLGSGSNLLIEGCTTQGFTTGIFVQGYVGRWNDARIRRNICLNGWWSDTSGGGTGMFLREIRGVLLEENVMGDTQGWIEVTKQIPLSHAVYMNSDGGPDTILSEVYAHGNLATNSAKGISVRNGMARIANNAVFNCGIGIISGIGYHYATGPIEYIENYVVGSKYGVAEFAGWDTRGVGWGIHTLSTGPVVHNGDFIKAGDQSRDDQHKAVSCEQSPSFAAYNIRIDGYEPPKQPPGANPVAFWLDQITQPSIISKCRVTFYGKGGTFCVFNSPPTPGVMKGTGNKLIAPSGITDVAQAWNSVSGETLVTIPNAVSLDDKPQPQVVDQLLLAALRDLRWKSPRLYMIGTNVSRNAIVEERTANP